MRTTLNLEDDVARVAKALAHEQNKSLGAVVSELARKGLRGGTIYQKKKTGLPVFIVREDSPPISAQDIKKDEDGW